MSAIVSQQSYVMPPRNVALRHGTHPLATNLESCWLFLEGSGAIAQDCTGLHPISLTSLVALGFTRTGLFHNGLVSSATVAGALGSVTGFPLLSVAYSIEVWFYVPNIGDTYGAIITEGSNKGLFLKVVSPGVKFSLFSNTGGGDHLGSFTFGLNAWHQGVVTYNNTSELTFYRNGIYDNKITGATDVSFTPDSLFNNNTSETFQGTIALLRVWRRRCLTSLEVKWLYNRPLDMFLSQQDLGSSIAAVGGTGLRGAFFQFFS